MLCSSEFLSWWWTEKHIYSLTKYQKLILNDVVILKNNVTVIPKAKNIENRDKINKIKNLTPVTQQPERVIEKVVEKQEVIKIVNLIPKITNNNNIRKITSQILSKPKEDNDNRPSVINENRVKVTEQIQNNKRCPVRDIRSHFKAKHPQETLPKCEQYKAIVWRDVCKKTNKVKVKRKFKEGHFISKKNNNDKLASPSILPVILLIFVKHQDMKILLAN